MHPFQETIEEIRTICRLHACPTGQWEHLIDLPLRLSQDSGLRYDFTQIVHTLQRSKLNLPDVLDILIVAVGGSSAPRHSAELSEQFNLLGGFLSSVGHWPAESFEPVLAPGEVPVDLHKFLRPPAPQERSSSPEHTLEDPTGIPARWHANGVEASASSEDPPSRSDSDHTSQNIPQPPSSRTAPVQAQQMEPAGEEPAPQMQGTQKTDPVAEIARALARLERGNLELRAHLDSIDQRISRMEPRLELGTPPPDSASEPDSPVLLHRGTPPGSARIPAFYPEPVELRHPEPVPTAQSSPRPARSEDERLRSEPVTSKPRQSSFPQSPVPRLKSAPALRAEAVSERLVSTSAYTDPTASIAPQSPPSSSGRTVGLAPTPIPIAPTARDPQPNAGSDAPPSTNPNHLRSNTAPIRPRFSRFSLENPAPDSPTPEAPSLPEPQFSFAPENPIPASKTEPRKPIPLPRGFFGTVPEPEHTQAESLTDPQPSPQRRSRRFGLAATAVLLLALLGGAGFLYRQSIATDPNATSDVAPTPAPRATPKSISGSTAGTVSSQGPLTASPTTKSSPAPGQTASARTPEPRSTFQPSQSFGETSDSGFRPAGTFVAASVMEGHLISAPIADEARGLASSGGHNLVTMEVNISNTGQVEDIHILGGSFALRSAAIETVRNWKYRPYLLNGTPVEVRTIVRVDLNQHRPQPAEGSAPFPQ